MNANDIPQGQGRTGMIDETPVAVFNQDGRIIVLENICTHLACQTEWNSEDDNWECPCHGSVFTAQGEVVNGPAKEPLNKLPFTLENDQIKLIEQAA